MSTLVTPRGAGSAEPEAGRPAFSLDEEFYTALGAATLPAIQTIAHELARSRGEQRDDP